eukprot:5619029-Amphidinium_carterae.1
MNSHARSSWSQIYTDCPELHLVLRGARSMNDHHYGACNCKKLPLRIAGELSVSLLHERSARNPCNKLTGKGTGLANGSKPHLARQQPHLRILQDSRIRTVK